MVFTKKMINTYNESSLHKSLKTLYSINNDSQIEVERDGHIYDILQKDGRVIEIQTKNVSKLYSKIKDAIDKGHKCLIVHPIVNEKIIITKDSSGKILSKRKSPKKESIYHLFRELTGIYPLLLDKNFSLELPFVSITEERLKTEDKVQSKNKKRRFKKDWIKIDKKLNFISERKIFSSKEDYMSLIPFKKGEDFTVNDLKKRILLLHDIQKSELNNISLMLWLYRHMGLIELIGKEGRSYLYRISE